MAPTFTATPGTEEALSDTGSPADVVERVAGLHRIGERTDVAGAIGLASNTAGVITGAPMIDGGRTAR
jgi:hypothetical protein